MDLTLRGDLQMHTTASDGALTTAELLRTAKAAGLAVVAITDHETIAGWPREAPRTPRVVRGVEISSFLDDQEFHLLGYFPGPLDVAASFLKDLEADRRRRFWKMVERAEAAGVPARNFLVIPEGNVSLGRPHLAAALVAAGAAASIADAFAGPLAPSGRFYVKRSPVPPIDVIEAFHADRGLVSLAHPAEIKGEIPWDEFRRWGLDAVEAYHPSADEERTRGFVERAENLGLLVTGGSDFHTPDESRPGVPFLPEGPLLRFLSALERQRLLPA